MIRLLYMYIDKRDLPLPHVDVVLLIPIGSLSITIRWSLSDQFAVFFDEKITKIRKAIDSVTPQLDITTPTTVQKAALSSLTEASVEEVSKIIMSCKPKSCALDSLPTDILKLTLPVHLDTITKLVNTSFSTGVFPSALYQTCPLFQRWSKKLQQKD